MARTLPGLVVRFPLGQSMTKMYALKVLLDTSRVRQTVYICIYSYACYALYVYECDECKSMFCAFVLLSNTLKQKPTLTHMVNMDPCILICWASWQSFPLSNPLLPVTLSKFLCSDQWGLGHTDHCRTTYSMLLATVIDVEDQGRQKERKNCCE